MSIIDENTEALNYNQLEYIEFLEMICNIIGVYWCIQVLILNTAVYEDDDTTTHWYNTDYSSLQSTIFLTYIAVILLIIIQFMIQLLQSSQKLLSFGTNSDSFMKSYTPFDENRYCVVEHISYQIER